MDGREQPKVVQEVLADLKKDRIIKTILLYNSILWERTNVAERNTTNPSSKGGDSKLILSETFTFLYFVSWA